MSNLGDRLRQIREERGVSPLQVEIDTRIRANVIQALEAGDYDSLPPEPFLRGLIRSYSSYLGADPQEMIDLHAADLAPAAPPPARQNLVPRWSATPVKPAAAPPAPEPARRATSPSLTNVPVFSAPGRARPEPAATLEPGVAAPPPPPPPPPEKFLPPERVPEAEGERVGVIETPILAHLTRRGLPLPVVALVGLAVLLFCFASTLVLVTRMGPLVFSGVAGRTGTPARPLATTTATLQAGAASTNIPTLAVTAAAFATFPGSLPGDSNAQTPASTNAGSGLVLDVDVTQTITIQVGIDNVMVFNGQMEPQTTRAWTAKNVLYVRVENPRGATLSLNGNAKWFNPRNYAERNVIERQWNVDDKGAPQSVPPSPPAASTPAPTNTSLFQINPEPSPTP